MLRTIFILTLFNSALAIAADSNGYDGYLCLLKKFITSQCGCVHNTANIEAWRSCQSIAAKKFDKEHDVEDEKLIDEFSQIECKLARELWQRVSEREYVDGLMLGIKAPKYGGYYRNCLKNCRSRVQRGLDYPEDYKEFKGQRFDEFNRKNK